MHIFTNRIALTAAGLLIGTLAWAQPGPGMGVGARSGPCATGAQDDTPPTTCQWRANRRNTPGLALMTPDERRAHRDRMRGMQSREECLAYLTEHHAEMAERAKAKGQTLPEPRSRLCERFPSAH